MSIADMTEYDFKQPPFEVHGVPFFLNTGRLMRLPSSLTDKLPKEFTLWKLDRRCPGARLCFRTDSKTIDLSVAFESISPDIGMSIYSAQSANVFFGDRQTPRYAGLALPSGYDSPVAKGSFRKSGIMEDVTVFLPRNEVITGITVGLESGAALEPPTPYRHPVPILYYGNSVTEGACCSKPANAYSALISRWLDVDYYNLGFSGLARGEIEMADYINSINKSVLVIDYDHNAPDAAYLRKTYKPFFMRIRACSPFLPVVLMSCSNTDFCPDYQERKQVIFDVYTEAKMNGDRNVYFVDGETLWGDADRDACTSDTIHPNDLGMYRTARTLYPLIMRIVEESTADAHKDPANNM